MIANDNAGLQQKFLDTSARSASCVNIRGLMSTKSSFAACITAFCFSESFTASRELEEEAEEVAKAILFGLLDIDNSVLSPERKTVRRD